MSAATKPLEDVEEPANGDVPQLRAAITALPAAEHPRDIRRKRPLGLSFLLHWDTARRAARVLVLLALDFAGQFV